MVKMNFLSHVNIRGSRWLYTSHAKCQLTVILFSHGCTIASLVEEKLYMSFTIEAFF
jgi:alpha/beta superfamily hydrolase